MGKVRAILASGVITLAGLASIPAARAAVIPYTCTAYGHYQTALGNSRTWITGASGCSSGFPRQYNDTACIYKNVIGTFWYTGPTRYGNGSSTSNYSGVTCTQYPYPSVVHVWMFFNLGSGWQVREFY